MIRQFTQFLARWLSNAVALFIASLLLSGVHYQNDWKVLVIAALILTIINSLIKPVAVILALPALLITVGLFSLVINGAMIYLAHLIYHPFQISSFWTAILAGMVIGLVNYILTRIFSALAREEI